MMDEFNRTPVTEILPDRDLNHTPEKAKMLADLEAIKAPAQEEYDRLERRDQALLARRISQQQAARARAMAGRPRLSTPPIRRSPAMRRS